MLTATIVVLTLMLLLVMGIVCALINDNEKKTDENTRLKKALIDVTEDRKQLEHIRTTLVDKLRRKTEQIKEAGLPEW